MHHQKINTLLIEDSGLMRIILGDILRSDARIELLDTASNGRDGIAKIQQLRPDVVITDMVMPEADGLEIVKHVVRTKPVPVVLLSSLEREHPKIFEALSIGAIDFLKKEEVVKLAEQQQYPLNELVKTVARISSEKLYQGESKRNTYNHSFLPQIRYDIIAIGASTGGPAAVEILLNGLPANLNIPVVIAQHMPEHFLHSFAKRLDKISPLQVKIAERGEYLIGGKIYILPGHSNTRIVQELATQRPVFQFTRRRYKEFNDPSIDGLFISIAEVYREKSIGVVLTGMGKDGTEGLRAIQQQQGYTIGQDEASSVVFGMPKHAIESEVVEEILSLRDMSGFLVSCLS